METEELWRWRIKWCGKWTTTSHHATQAQIRIEHPEATSIVGTRIERQVTLSAAPQPAQFSGIMLIIGAIKD